MWHTIAEAHDIAWNTVDPDAACSARQEIADPSNVLNWRSNVDQLEEELISSHLVERLREIEQCKGRTLHWLLLEGVTHTLRKTDDLVLTGVERSESGLLVGQPIVGFSQMLEPLLHMTSG